MYKIKEWYDFFQSADTNHSGKINVMELNNLLRRMGIIIFIFSGEIETKL